MTRCKFLVAGFLSLMTAQLAQADLVLHWTLDEAPGALSVADSSGNGFTGTVAGSPTFDTAAGKIGGAVRFSNIDNQNINVMSTSLVTGYPATISLWVKTTSTQNDTAAVLGTGFFDRYMSMRVNSGSAMLTHRYGTENNLNGGAVNNNTWRHIVGVFDGSTRSLYVDGALKGTNTATIAWQIVDRFAIGALNRATDNVVDEYDGWVDDVQVYSQALTLSDVQHLYTNPGATLIPEPAALPLLAAGLLAIRRRR